MKIENDKIVEATENELFEYYLDRGYDDVMMFSDFLCSMRKAGVKIIADK